MHGIVKGQFIEQLLLDRIEELEELEGLERSRDESARPFADAMAELKRDGQI